MFDVPYDTGWSYDQAMEIAVNMVLADTPVGGTAVINKITICAECEVMHVDATVRILGPVSRLAKVKVGENVEITGS